MNLYFLDLLSSFSLSKRHHSKLTSGRIVTDGSHVVTRNGKEKYTISIYMNNQFVSLSYYETSIQYLIMGEHVRIDMNFGLMHHSNMFLRYQWLEVTMMTIISNFKKCNTIIRLLLNLRTQDLI
jgi:hypothetical protein